ncbi:hypothetical protein ATHL_00899 [Anaerolinea thermolimosa]|uniref:hypothetical protein n=1 Tax=Anaerolinea thermolimosa TaxID=229919 RepID=UPI000784D03C|nr:hypothetical protein [Anaerolinea thermolimosa]GAP06053.1 hypothetical protein ATHL_00899 [Anaerolinea thermolimosa]
MRIFKVCRTQGIQRGWYPLVPVLLLSVLAKMHGEDRPGEIAGRAKHRTTMLVEWLRLKRRNMPHHSPYWRILAEVVGGKVGAHLTGLSEREEIH